MVGLEIITPAGSGIIEKIYISELNYLMIKIKLGQGFITYNLGKKEKDFTLEDFKKLI